MALYLTHIVGEHSTSPSVYVAYHDVSASNICGQLGVRLHLLMNKSHHQTDDTGIGKAHFRHTCF